MLHEFSTRKDIDSSENTWIQQLSQIDIFVQSDFLKDVVIIDTPGLNAPNVEDHTITEQILEEADAILWLSPCTAALSRTQVDKLKDLQKRYSDKSVLILSMIDKLKRPQKELPALINHIKKEAKGVFIDIIPISGHLALEEGLQHLKSFFHLFYTEIIPKQQTWVRQSVLTDIKNDIDIYCELTELENQDLADLQTHLDSWIEKAHRFHKTYLDGIQKNYQKLIQECKKIQDKIITDVRKDMDTYEGAVQVQKVDEGWFSDDYYVVWEKRDYYKISEASMEDLNTKYTNIMDKLNQLYDRNRTVLDQYSTSIIEAFEENCLEGFRNCTNESFRLRTDVFDEAADFLWWLVPYKVSQGIMLGGYERGIWTLYHQLRASELEKKPSKKEMRELIEVWIPLQDLIGFSPNDLNQIKEQSSDTLNTLIERCHTILKESQEESKRNIALWSDIKKAIKKLR